MLFALMMLALSLVFLMNDYRISDPPPEEIPRENNWQRSGVMADIVVSGIDIKPLVPRAGEAFVLNVFCQNRGIIPTGRYTLDVSVSDASGNELYTGRTSRNTSLEPGQTGLSFSSSIISGTVPGRYSISVQLTPDDFEDENPGNNKAVRTIEFM
ncbi:MAG: hypothetical protein ISR54_01235 [Chlorobium phaeobacteroides]|uniref:CARDB domain-containing protein n=1 Tax=Chlorobium phaeobacteroides (strain BS1) TaxID=331678 RepID=B3EMJ3_CHLPB|nr:hypothetical protein [Chlorobium phaeobacteroides]